MRILCQNCATPNPGSQALCVRCRAQLHIVTIPRRHRHLFAEPDGIEEHILERISTLETELEKLRARNDRLLDLVHRQANASFNDRALLDAVVSLLEEHSGLDTDAVELRWRQLVDRYSEELDERDRLEERSREISLAYGGTDRPSFDRLVDDGMQLVLGGDERRGVRRLEKALLLDPANGPLGKFLGEHFFFAGRPSLARHYLERAASNEPRNTHVALMLGVVCGDDGETESARLHFERALALRKDSFLAHYGLGRLHAVEGRFREALVHFKRALTLSPSAEMHYLVGRIYLEQERVDVAERHLRKAVDLDPTFDQALYHLGLILMRQSDVTRARELFLAAAEVNPDERRYRTAISAKSAKRLVSLPVFGPGRIAKRRSITNGDARFTLLVMQTLADDAFGSLPGAGK
ncbi:MAG: tetratricopeptide repeat protein [Acidobacteria bacterium]|nr:tetratricopeptide repeat protein [Acidobacteriota bacterium]